MAYESMKTEDLKIELIRRTEDIDSWANEINIEKTKKDIFDELDKGDKFNKQLDEKINKCIKKYRIFKNLAIISLVLSLVSFLFVFILNLRIEISIAFSFLTMLFASFTKCDVDLRNEHQERSEILFWYYSLMREVSIKKLYKKAYDSLYNAKIEGTEADFSFLQKELLDYITNHITDLEKHDCGALQIYKDDHGKKLVDIEWCDGISAFDFDKVMALLEEKIYVTKKELVEYCL